VNLSGSVYTIVGNPKINKIVALIPGTQSQSVSEAIAKEIPYSERLSVREVTLDMSRSMDSIASQLFPQAKRTLDRFHVTKNVLEDIQALRIRIKTDIKAEELSREDECRRERKPYHPKRLENSETRLDLVSRLHYQLFKRRQDWNVYQVRRWEVLMKHEQFFELRSAYKLLEVFYEIYDQKITREEARPLWNIWFQRISQYETIQELQNTGRMVKNHLEGILNYFDERSTNAFAE
jgi:transposase